MPEYSASEVLASCRGSLLLALDCPKPTLIRISSMLIVEHALHLSTFEWLNYICSDLAWNMRRSTTGRLLVKKTYISSATSPAPHSMVCVFIQRRDRRSFAMNSPHPGQIVSSPTSLASLERAVRLHLHEKHDAKSILEIDPHATACAYNLASRDDASSSWLRWLAA